MKLALIGHPLYSSLSPRIHRMIAGGELEYVLLDIEPEDVGGDLKERLRDLDGFNVTAPYKRSILRFCDRVSERAAKIGAVNTVHIVNGEWKAYNTDHRGFMLSAGENIGDLLSYAPAVLGYGGSARAVLFALEDLGFPSAVLCGGRDPRKRRDLINEMQEKLKMRLREALPAERRLWINCTPLGSVKAPELPEDPPRFRKGDVLYDLNYAPDPTYLERRAQQEEVPTVNGLSMLVCQAEEAQKIWQGKDFRPAMDRESILRSLREIRGRSI